MLMAKQSWSCLYWPQHYECYQQPWCLWSLHPWLFIWRANYRERTGAGGPSFRIYLPRYQAHLCIHATHVFFCVHVWCSMHPCYTRFLWCTYVWCSIFVYISRRAVKTHTLEVLVFSVFAGKIWLFVEVNPLLPSNVRLLTASRPYACHAQPFYPSRMAFHFL